ncbi:hypothetical protein [Sediminitomix flava]|nr:hypothetical protein [Sediminitomix flava]
MICLNTLLLILPIAFGKGTLYFTKQKKKHHLNTIEKKTQRQSEIRLQLPSYKIEVVTGSNVSDVHLSVSSNLDEEIIFLRLNVASKHPFFTYQVYDNNSRLIQAERVKSSTSLLNVSRHSSTSFFMVKVYEAGKIKKVFKVSEEI